MLDTTIEKILGNQFPSLNEVNLSGKALYNMADYMSSSNEIFIQNLVESMTAVGQIILDTMPKLMAPQTIGLVPTSEDPSREDSQLAETFEYDFNFVIGHYQVEVTRGVNYKLQQQKNIEMLLEFGRLYPPLLQFLFTDGFKFMLGNMDFNDKESLSQAYDRYQRKIEEAQNMPEGRNLQEMAIANKSQELKNQELNAEANILRAQTDQQKLGLEAHKLHHDKSATVMDDLVEVHKIEADLGKNRLDNLTKLLHIESTQRNLAERMRHGAKKI